MQTAQISQEPNRAATRAVLSALFAQERFVRNVLLKSGCPQAELEDLVQEVFLKAFTGIDRFENRSNLQTWLYTLTTRTAWRFKQARRRSATDPLLHDFESSSPSPEELSIASEQHAELGYAFGQLPSRKRDVLALYYGGGASLAEVASMTRCTPRAARARLRSARQELAHLLRRNAGIAASLPANRERRCGNERSPRRGVLENWDADLQEVVFASAAPWLMVAWRPSSSARQFVQVCDFIASAANDCGQRLRILSMVPQGFGQINEAERNELRSNGNIARHAWVAAPDCAASTVMLGASTWLAQTPTAVFTTIEAAAAWLGESTVDQPSQETSTLLCMARTLLSTYWAKAGETPERVRLRASQPSSCDA